MAVGPPLPTLSELAAATSVGKIAGKAFQNPAAEQGDFAHPTRDA
jgi:hypothetical protein